MQTTSITKLRNELINVFDRLKEGSIDCERAKEMNNTAGKIIKTVGIQIAYSGLRKEKPEIEFLKD